MRQERWFRDSNESSTFDWQRSARDLDVSLDIARALYLRATRITDAPHRAEVLYLRWLRDATTARPPVSLSSVPGRQTRVEYEAGGHRRLRPQDVASVGPGKWTRSLLETEVDNAFPGAQDVHSSIAALNAGAMALAGIAQRQAQTLWRRGAGDADPRQAVVDEALRAGGGEPLPEELRRELEVQLGAPLARVRLHTDDAAARAAEALHAHAFTVGEDVFFAAGAYAPSTEVGRRLLVHELTHVVQSYQGRIPTATERRVSQPHDPLEREAEAKAAAAPAPAPAPAPAVEQQVTPAAPDHAGLLLREGAQASEDKPTYDKQKLLDAIKVKEDAAGAIKIASIAPTQAMNDLCNKDDMQYRPFWNLVAKTVPHEGATKSQLAIIFNDYKGSAGDVWSVKRCLIESQFDISVWEPGDPQNVDKVPELNNLYAAACQLTLKEVQDASFIAKNRAKEATPNAQNAGANQQSGGTPKAEPTPGEKFRADILAELGIYNNSEENDATFSKFRTHDQLETTRKAYAKEEGKGGTTYTTCIDYMLFIKGKAESDGGVKTRAPLNADVADTTTSSVTGKTLTPDEKKNGVKSKAQVAKDRLGDAWVPATPGMKQRPLAGDLIILTFAKNVAKDAAKPATGDNVKSYKGSFSHMGFLVNSPTYIDGTASELWKTEDGGQGVGGKYYVSYPTEQDKANKTNPVYTVADGKVGHEKIVTNDRWYLPEKNLISGEKNQDNDARTLLGWIDIAKVVQPKSAGPLAADAKLQRPSGPGRPLDEVVRRQMEAAFGVDFSDVRVHEGDAAAELGALAYTEGHDVHFAPGRYRPGTPEGNELIGHELAHVVQQRAGRVTADHEHGPVVRSHALEAEADRLGAAAAATRPAPTAPSAPGHAGAPPMATSPAVAAPSAAGVQLKEPDAPPSVSESDSATPTDGGNAGAASGGGDFKFEYGKVDKSEPDMTGKTLIEFADKWNKAKGDEGKKTAMFFVQPSTPTPTNEKKDKDGLTAATVKISWAWNVAKWKEGTADSNSFHKLEIKAYKDAHDAMVAHEDGHVDIDKSIYTDAAISGMKGKSHNDLIDKINKLTTAADEANQKYDDRTGHGVNQTSTTSTHLRIPNKQEMVDSKDAGPDSGAEPAVQRKLARHAGADNSVAPDTPVPGGGGTASP